MIERDVRQIEAERREKGSLVNFFELDTEQMAALREQVSRANGTARLWIHTHFDEALLGSNLEWKGNVEAGVYAQQRAAMITEAGAEPSPVISFIGEGKGEKAQLIHSRYYGPARNLRGFFFLPTPRTNPVPLVPEVEEAFADPLERAADRAGVAEQLENLVNAGVDVGELVNRLNVGQSLSPAHMTAGEYKLLARGIESLVRRKKMEASWNALTARLDAVGIKVVTLSGRNYKEKEVKDTEEYCSVDAAFIAQQRRLSGGQTVFLPGQCVGEAAKQLAIRGVRVSLSDVLYPNKPSELVAQTFAVFS